MLRNGYSKRVCIVVNHENTILLFREELITALKEKEHEVFVLLPSFCKGERIKQLGAQTVGYDLRQHGTNLIEEIRSLQSILQKLKMIDPDIVLTYTVKPNLYAGAICRFKRIPYIATITGLGRGFEKSSLISTVMLLSLRFSLRKAKRVFFQNERTEQCFVPQYVKPSQSILVNGSGVSLEKNIFEEYPNNEVTQLLFVGRVTRDKGVKELFDAVCSINKDNVKVKLLLVGPVEEDGEEYVKQVQGKEYISFLGMKNQQMVHEHIKQSDAVIVPSYHEGMCNALLEAAAAGRPVITTKIPGCIETFEEEITGFGCEPRNSDSLKACIEKFLSLDREERQSMGRHARAKMEREFDRAGIIRKYVKQVETE